MDIHYAYALGYYHGRAVGMENNPYSGETEAKEHALYTEGYGRGVTDYCHEYHPDEHNN